MTRDDIIKMAREAGLIPPPLDWPQKYAEALERFAALVAAAEREACAKVCDEAHRNPSAEPDECAAAIRARGQE